MLPCEEDLKTSGREWVEGCPPKTRSEVVEMALMCQPCPIIEECRALGEQMKVHTEGVWGGMFIVSGTRGKQMIDPLGVEDGSDMSSVYQFVSWDRSHNQWRVAKWNGERMQTVSYHRDEDEAGQVAAQFLEDS